MNDKLSTNNRAASDHLQAMNETQFVVDKNPNIPKILGFVGTKLRLLPDFFRTIGAMTPGRDFGFVRSLTLRRLRIWKLRILL